MGLKELLSKGRFLIAVFAGICIFFGSCHLSSGEASRYDFSPLDSLIQGWVDKGYYPGASIGVVVDRTGLDWDDPVEK